jgi:hypothetical protein
MNFPGKTWRCRRRLLPALLSSGLLAACAGGPRLDAEAVSGENIQNLAIVGAGEQLIGPSLKDWTLFGLAYLIYDPLAPNWEIEETRLSEDRFYLQLRMKRYFTGGEGEAKRIFQRRAAQLQRELGYFAFRILDYSEGIDSQTLAARRFGEGSIQLVRR